MLLNNICKLTITSFTLFTFGSLVWGNEMDESRQTITNCKCTGLSFSLSHAVKDIAEMRSITINAGSPGHFNFRRGMTLGSSELNNIRSISINNNDIVIELDTSYANDPDIQKFEFNNVQEECLDNIRSLIPLLEGRIGTQNK